MRIGGLDQIAAKETSGGTSLAVTNLTLSRPALSAFRLASSSARWFTSTP